jgi:hypothetical protein
MMSSLPNVRISSETLFGLTNLIFPIATKLLLISPTDFNTNVEGFT